MPNLTPTAYAILGLLALRPWSVYELTKYMRCSTLRAIWPRAESRLYAEPKRLVVRGLARSRAEYQGARKRTVYEITPQGRAQLRAWLDTSSKPLTYQTEAMLKINFADLGTRATLQGNVDRLREEATRAAEEMLEVVNGFVEDEAAYRERRHVNALVDAFILEEIEAQFRWVEFAQAFIDGWTKTKGDKALASQGDQWFLEAKERLATLLSD